MRRLWIELEASLTLVSIRNQFSGKRLKLKHRAKLIAHEGNIAAGVGGKGHDVTVEDFGQNLGNVARIVHADRKVVQHKCFHSIQTQ